MLTFFLDIESKQSQFLEYKEKYDNDQQTNTQSGLDALENGKSVSYKSGKTFSLGPLATKGL